MKYAIVTLTSGAFETGKKIRHVLEESDLFTLPNRNDGTAQNIEEKFSEFTAGIFYKYEVIVFIMAAGIVVRTIAPLIKSKIEDPAVLVMDEKGKFAVSLLSGHLGGANDAALLIADKTGAQAVITTATDVNDLTAVDMLAKQNGLIIDSMDDCKEVTSIMVNGGSVSIESDIPVTFPRGYVSDRKSADAVVFITNKRRIDSPGCSVKLIPANIIIGMGSRKDADTEETLKFLYGELDRLNIDPRAVKCIATIDLKKNEPAIVEAARNLGTKLIIFTADEISEVEDLFESSDFVKSAVGVSSVSGPSAYLASNRRGKMIAEKLKANGVTISILQED